MFKRKDLIIFALIGLIFGFFLVRQFYATREVRKLLQPETNEVIALEVAKLTKSNAELRQEVANLDSQINSYNQSWQNQSTANDALQADLKRYQQINGDIPIAGRGLILKINYKLTQPQLVDLANTIRNIGVDAFAINGQRVLTGTQFLANSNDYEFSIVGNPTLVRSALTRKGGFLDLLFPGANEYVIIEKDSVTIDSSQTQVFNFAKSINN